MRAIHTSGVVFLLLGTLAGQVNADSRLFLSQRSWYADWDRPQPASGNPFITLSPGQTTTLYLWAAVGDDWIDGLALDILCATPGVAQATDVSIDLSGAWSLDSQLPTPGQLATGMDLVATSPDGGLPGTNPSWYPNLVYVDQILGLHRVAALTIQGLAPGTTEVFITPNDDDGGVHFRYGGPLVNFGYDLYVYEGSGTFAPPDGEYTLVIADLADATIIVTPEPASPCLLGLASLTLLRRFR